MVLTNKVAMTAPGLTTIPIQPNPTMQPSLQLPSIPQPTLTTAPTGGWIPASPCLIGGLGNLLWGKDSRWLTLDVCREFGRNKCCRSDEECRYAHPPPNVEVQNGRVMCCFDSIKGKCQRKEPPCKYLHPPQHLKEQLLQNGRNNLILKHINMQLLASGFLPAYPSLVYDMSGTLASYSAPGYTTQVSSMGDPYNAGSQYVVTSPNSYYAPYPMMPFIPQQQQQQQQHQQNVSISLQPVPRCAAGSVGSVASSDQGSTSDQHTECNSPDDATYQQPAGITVCGAYCGSAADDQAKIGVVTGGGRSIPYAMGGAETCPAPVNLIPCSPYYSPVYLPNVASYNNGSLPAVISPGVATLKGAPSSMMQEGKCNFENGNPEIDCNITERCNGYVMYPVTAPNYAPATGYAPITAPTQHLAYVPYPVNGHQYSLPPQFSSPSGAVMTRY